LAFFGQKAATALKKSCSALDQLLLNNKKLLLNIGFVLAEQ